MVPRGKAVRCSALLGVAFRGQAMQGISFLSAGLSYAMPCDARRGMAQRSKEVRSAAMYGGEWRSIPMNGDVLRSTALPTISMHCEVWYAPA